MVFKRRKRRGWTQTLIESVYPRGGWMRAMHYIKHRLRRLPDPPHKIARGIWAGVFISFTPLFGFHLIGAALIAWAFRGNLIAAVIGTFFGNPLTYVPLGVMSVGMGNWMLGRRLDDVVHLPVGEMFMRASQDLWANFWAIFTPHRAHWDGLVLFYDDIFMPYLIGCIAPGILAATICYYLTIPLVRYYQDHRRARLLKRIAERKRAVDATAGSARSHPQAGE